MTESLTSAAQVAFDFYQHVLDTEQLKKSDHYPDDYFPLDPKPREFNGKVVPKEISLGVEQAYGVTAFLYAASNYGADEVDDKNSFRDFIASLNDSRQKWMIKTSEYFADQAGVDFSSTDKWNPEEVAKLMPALKQHAPNLARALEHNGYGS